MEGSTDDSPPPPPFVSGEPGSYRAVWSLGGAMSMPLAANTFVHRNSGSPRPQRGNTCFVWCTEGLTAESVRCGGCIQ